MDLYDRWCPVCGERGLGIRPELEGHGYELPVGDLASEWWSGICSNCSATVERWTDPLVNGIVERIEDKKRRLWRRAFPTGIVRLDGPLEEPQAEEQEPAHYRRALALTGDLK